MTYKGQWKELMDCMAKHQDDGTGEISQRLRLSCRQYEIPFEIRNDLAEWIEVQPWDRIDNEEIEIEGKKLYTAMLGELQKCKQQKKDQVYRFSICGKEQKIKERYKSNPGDLVRNMKACLTQERLLIDSTVQENSGERERTYYMEGSYSVKQKMDEVKSKSNEFDTRVGELQRKTEAFLAHYRSYQEELRKIEIKLQQDKLTDDRKNALALNKQQLDDSCTHETKTVYMEREKAKSKLIDICADVLAQLDKVTEYIDIYEKQQKMNIVDIQMGPPEGAVKDLNSMCEALNEMMVCLRQSFEQVKLELGKINFDRDQIPLEIEKHEALFNDAFEKLLNRIVIIDHHPNQVLKISKGRSVSFPMTLRVLGPKSLGLNVALPVASANLHPEKDLPLQMRKNEKVGKGICTINGAENIKAQFKNVTGQMTINFSSAQITSVKRPESRNREERVTEMKYGMIFSTMLNIGGFSHLIKKLSLPIILTSQSSQEWAAKGNLIWDACFSDDKREFYKDATKVKWKDIANVINVIFEKNTTRSLDAEQLQFLAQRVFGGSFNTDYSEYEITKEKFIKENLAQATFSLWKWVYACLNLIKDCLLKEWQQGLIMGFVSRERANELLQNCEPGTFLLRFKTGALHETQSATICALITPTAVVAVPGGKRISHMDAELNQQKLSKKGLASYLRSAEVRDSENKNVMKALFTTLYPNIPFDTAFKDLLHEADVGGENYDPLIEKVEVRLKDMSFECASVPASPVSSCSYPDSEIAPSPVETVAIYDTPMLDESDLANYGSDDLVSIINFIQEDGSVTVEPNPAAIVYASDGTGTASGGNASVGVGSMGVGSVGVGSVGVGKLGAYSGSSSPSFQLKRMCVANPKAGGQAFQQVTITQGRPPQPNALHSAHGNQFPQTGQFNQSQISPNGQNNTQMSHSGDIQLGQNSHYVSMTGQYNLMSPNEHYASPVMAQGGSDARQYMSQMSQSSQYSSAMSPNGYTSPVSPAMSQNGLANAMSPNGVQYMV